MTLPSFSTFHLKPKIKYHGRQNVNREQGLCTSYIQLETLLDLDWVLSKISKIQHHIIYYIIIWNTKTDWYMTIINPYIQSKE